MLQFTFLTKDGHHHPNHDQVSLNTMAMSKFEGPSWNVDQVHANVKSIRPVDLEAPFSLQKGLSGCGQDYDANTNNDAACRFHSAGPVFHDALKSWACCNTVNKPVSTFDEVGGSQPTKRVLFTLYILRWCSVHGHPWLHHRLALQRSSIRGSARTVGSPESERRSRCC